MSLDVRLEDSELKLIILVLEGSSLRLHRIAEELTETLNCKNSDEIILQIRSKQKIIEDVIFKLKLF